jgi:hypothetical protein
MADLLIQDIDPNLNRRLHDSARQHNQSVSEEAKSLISRALAIGLGSDEQKRPSEPKKGLGTAMMELIQPEDRGDDLVFEVRGEIGEPPRFE